MHFDLTNSFDTNLINALNLPHLKILQLRKI